MYLTCILYNLTSNYLMEWWTKETFWKLITCNPLWASAWSDVPLFLAIFCKMRGLELRKKTSVHTNIMCAHEIYAAANPKWDEIFMKSHFQKIIEISFTVFLKVLIKLLKCKDKSFQVSFSFTIAFSCLSTFRAANARTKENRILKLF